MARKKITVVGAGNVRATTAQRLAEKEFGDVVPVVKIRKSYVKFYIEKGVVLIFKFYWSNNIS